MALVSPVYGKEATTIETITIIAFGDSLTAGYGIADVANAFPAKLEQKLQQDGYNVRVINAGVSGDTTADGKARIGWVLDRHPQAAMVIVELGANDMLRALPPEAAGANLDAILAAIQARQKKIVLAGMRASPNLGPDYVARFGAIYPALAKKYQAVLYPFFLEDVAARAELNSSDQIHPNEKGVEIIVKNIAPTIEKGLNN